MFTMITSIACCKSQRSNGVDAYQSETIQNVAKTVDILVGAGLIVGGVLLKSTAMAAIGGISISPLLFTLAITGLACKEGKAREEVLVRFRPCCRKGAS